MPRWRLARGSSMCLDNESRFIMKRLLLATASIFIVGCDCAHPQHSASDYQPERQASFVGPRGADGPAGATGPQGPTGRTGEPGYAMAGPRGADGPVGATGNQGRVGDRGPAGDMVIGPAGEAGPVGNTGEQGRIGDTGPRGASTEGFAGPVGPAGGKGAEGPAGATGAKGPEMAGPAGPAGRQGPTGERGVAGLTGAQGSTTEGVIGPAGTAGMAGAQGHAGPTGPQGTTFVVDRWSTYQNYWFDADKSTIRDSDSDRTATIAAYMKANPALQLGIDSGNSPRATERREQDLCDRRGKAVRDALIQAGVASERISQGNFSTTKDSHDRRVEVLLKSGASAKAEETVGPTGAQTAARTAQRWTSYRVFSFDANKAAILDSDAPKAYEIAAFAKENPSMQIGIDGSTNPRATEREDKELCDRRAKAVRSSLVQAGVPDDRISEGTFGDASLRRDQCVEVLVRTRQLTQAQ